MRSQALDLKPMALCACGKCLGGPPVERTCVQAMPACSYCHSRNVSDSCLGRRRCLQAGRSTTGELDKSLCDPQLPNSSTVMPLSIMSGENLTY